MSDNRDQHQPGEPMPNSQKFNADDPESWFSSPTEELGETKIGYPPATINDPLCNVLFPGRFDMTRNCGRPPHGRDTPHVSYTRLSSGNLRESDRSTAGLVHVDPPINSTEVIANLPDDINPGIRRLVELLNLSGFKTVDSGDGDTHLCTCDRDWAFVVVETDPYYLVSESTRLARRIEKLCPGLRLDAIGPEDAPPDGVFTVDASYQPFIRRAFIAVDGAADKHLAPRFHGEISREIIAWLEG